jgi:hypothetical protein
MRYLRFNISDSSERGSILVLTLIEGIDSLVVVVVVVVTACGNRTVTKVSRFSVRPFTRVRP